MDWRLDFTDLLKKHDESLKNMPTQFTSVAGGVLSDLIGSATMQNVIVNVIIVEQFDPGYSDGYLLKINQVQKRLETNIKYCKSNRLNSFDRVRNLQECQIVVSVTDARLKVEARRQQLEKWKKIKTIKVKEQAAQKKKPFVTGIVRAPLHYVPPPPPRQMVPSTSGRVTKSITARVAVQQNFGPELYNIAPNNAAFKPPPLGNFPKLPALGARKSAKPKNTKSIKFEPAKHSTPNQNFFHCWLRSPKSPIEAVMTPEQIAEEVKKICPCVTMSKGKDNARRDMKQKPDEGLFDEDASNMESVEYFRKQHASEIKRMTSMCDTWDRILKRHTLPDTVQECVLAATGQARLLMSSKLAQYAALVERCGRPDPAALVTLADLRGFRDMVFIQVKDIDLRFNKLEKLRVRGWQEEQPVIGKPKIDKHLKLGGTTVKPSGGPSKLKEIISAAKRAKKERSNPPPAPTEIKTFDAGFFSLESPVRCPLSTHNIPQRETSLRMAVLPSEVKKSASKNAPFAMLRVSVVCKNMGLDGFAPLPKKFRMKPKLLRQEAVAERSPVSTPPQETPLNKSGKVLEERPCENEKETLKRWKRNRIDTVKFKIE